MLKLTFFFALLIAVPFIVDEVQAQEIEKGENYDIESLGISNGVQVFTWTSQSPRIESASGEWVEYILLEDNATIRVESGRGSFEIDKNTCEFSFYNKGKIKGKPTIPSDVYKVRQSVDQIVWNEVDQINNAPCQTATIINGDNIEIQTIRSHALGEMKIRYIKEAGQPIKTQMEVTNTSGLNDRYFGFYQTIGVPRFIQWGDQSFDLALRANTFYDRDFIIANQDKLLALTDKITYDFEKGFKHLAGITILWIDGKAYLEFDYSFNSRIILDGQTFVIDPTLVVEPAYDATIRDTDNNEVCGNFDSTFIRGATSTILKAKLEAMTDPTNDCHRAIMIFDISAIGQGSTFTAGSITIEVTQNNNDEQIRFWSINSTDVNPVDQTPAEIWTAISSHPDLLNNWINPVGTQSETLTLDVVGDLPGLQARFEDGFCCWIGVLAANFTMDPVLARGINFQSSEGAIPPSLSITYTLPQNPDAVTDLTATNVQVGSTDLAWTAPNIFGAFLDGYQINFTTPQGLPQTVIVNNTQTTTVEYDITGLTSQTPYSFRIGIWTDTQGNASGNIANITTDSLGNFTVGFFDINTTNVDARDIRYTRVDVTGSNTDLIVDFPNTFNTSCNFHYKFAQKNDTYFPLTTQAISGSRDQVTFQFINIQNEVIDVRCTDTISNVSAPYLLTITDFPLLQQFQNFTSGVYGTQGDFGSIDLITLGIIIIMMVGFNRSNESVGAIFAVVIIGVTTFFGITEWYSFMFGTFAVVIMLTIASTRKM